MVLNLLHKMLVLQLIFHDERIGAPSKTYNNNFCLTSGGMNKKGPVLPSLCQKSPEEIKEKLYKDLTFIEEKKVKMVIKSRI